MLKGHLSKQKTLIARLLEPTSGESVGVKSDTVAGWASRPTFVPKKDTIIVYTDYKTITEDSITKLVAGVKIGDGETTVGELTFIDDELRKIVLDYINTTVIPTNTSQLTNDSGFITNTVNNLTNYYLKSETYTQAEVNALIDTIKTIEVQIVAQLPTASADTYFNTSKTIYLVAYTGSGNDYYNEYITVRTGTEGSYTYSWEKIGNTQIDLTNYVQKTTTIAGVDLQDNITKSELKDALDIKFIVTDGRYIEDDTVKTSSGSIAQTGTTLAEDGGWVQPQAEGRGSAAFGRGTVAGGQQDWNNPDNNNHDYAFASGKNSKAYGDSSFVANRGNTVTGANAAGFNESTQAKGKDSFSAGYGSIAYDKGTFATGYYTEAKGEYSFTANSGDTNGKYAFAANEETRANAEAASSFGRSTQATAQNAMATGHSTVAGHTSSFAGGESTQTSKDNQTVVGQYNTDNSDALFIVGDGTANNARSNCFEAGKDGNGKFIKVGSTKFNENEIAKKSNIPTSINGLSGGTLTSQLNITGGDASSDAKIAMSNAGSGQITDETTHTLFGFTSNGADTLTIGHNNYKTNIRGSGTRPTYKGDDLALLSDVGSVKSVSINSSAITPDANGDVALPISYGENHLGLVKTDWEYYSGLAIANDGTIRVSSATDTQITGRNSNRPITPTKLNASVKAALTDTNHLTMTSAEQAVAKSVLGINDAGLHFEIVSTLDTASSTTWFDNSKTIYLVPNSSQAAQNVYDEYITIRNGAEGSYTYSWEQIGSTAVDLSNYVPTSRTIAGVDLQDNITTNELSEALGVNTLTGSGAPTSSTAGMVGQQYIDTTGQNVYECISKTAQGTDPETYTYGWKLLNVRVSGLPTGLAYNYALNELMLSDASNAGIDNRASAYGTGYGAITPKNLDYAASTTYLKGNSAPTTSTVGFEGQLYLNSADNITYQCTAVTAQGTDPETYTYTWKKLANVPIYREVSSADIFPPTNVAFEYPGQICVVQDTRYGRYHHFICRQASNGSYYWALLTPNTGTGTDSISLGQDGSATGYGSVSYGAGAHATANWAIQIGSGTNSTAQTFNVGFGGGIGNYQLLNSNGKIPQARISDCLTGSSAPTTSTAADYIGQLYRDTTNDKIYVCENITTENNTTTYTWTQLIKFTDKASSSAYGIVKIAQGRGLDFLSDGGLFVDVAGTTQIDNRTNGRPIATAQLNYAVTAALTDANHITLNSTQQATAQSVLGLNFGIARLG